jgi:hypothetical protein
MSGCLQRLSPEGDADQACFASGSSSAGPGSRRRVAVAPSVSEPSTLLVPFQLAGAQFAKLSPNEKAAASAVLACSATILVFQGYRKWWRRVRSVDHVLPRMLGGSTWVRGTVTRCAPILFGSR